MFNRCEFCGSPLPSGSRSSARFCSVKCKQAAYRRRADPETGTIQREAERIRKSVQTKQATLIERTCGTCKHTFSVEATRINTEYCSAACKQKAYRQRKAQAEQDQPEPFYLDYKVSDIVKVIKAGDPDERHLGKITFNLRSDQEPAPDHYAVMLEDAIARHVSYYHKSELEIVLFSCDAGPRGIQQLIDRVSVAYRQRYGHQWTYEGGKVEAKTDGYYLTVDGTTYYLQNHQQAKNHITDYFQRGVSNQAMLRAR